jgi:hypothetical protein
MSALARPRRWRVQCGREHGSREVDRVDGFYLYQVGSQIHPLSQIIGGETGTLYRDAYFPVVIAEGALEPLLSKSVFRLKTSLQTGLRLLSELKGLKGRIEASGSQGQKVEIWEAYTLSSALSSFEAVLQAELGVLNLYMVQRPGYDTSDLVENGQVLFPEELPRKVPEALGDIRQGTRCIAFELPTAAGFHFHRANESVLHRYWDAVTKGAPRPTNRNMGDYLNQLRQMNAGDPKVLSALKDLKDLHRNPLMHPEESLETVDQALALMNSVHNVVVHMLREMPEVVPPPVQGGTAVAPVSPSP